MRIAIIGQQDFGKAVLEAFLARGDEAAAVFCAPEKEGARPDALRAAAEEKGLKVCQFKSLRAAEAARALAEAEADIGVMAFVLQFAPQEFVGIPAHGTIQFHPSLLPKFRGPSSINWPLIKGETETGLTIFRPSDGLDEGAVILQKKTPVSADDTLGTVYFDRLFPMGVAAMLEAADLVVAGRHKETIQDESRASYEGWCREGEARINWATHVDFIHNLIRGCDPAPGAWTTHNGEKLQLFGSKKHLARTFGAVKGGQIEVAKGKLASGKKVSSSDLGIAAGTILGS